MGFKSQADNISHGFLATRKTLAQAAKMVPLTLDTQEVISKYNKEMICFLFHKY